MGEPRDPETYAVIGAAMEVHGQLGCGFLEAVYQECLAREFNLRAIPFIASPRLTLAYKGEALRQTYRPDFICFDMIIIELKATRELTPEHRAQVLNYLNATGYCVGVLINFGSDGKLEWKRFVN